MEQRQLREAVTQARRADAAKTDFLRRMSHDIRTPINGIRGMVEIARHYVGNRPSRRNVGEKIMVASGFLLELVNNVLDMNKLESGKVQLEAKTFCVRDLVEKAPPWSRRRRRKRRSPCAGISAATEATA